MLTMKELRQMIEDFPKREGTVNIKPDPIVNEGYPGTFNMSYSEKYMLDLFGKDMKIYDIIVHKIQPCIRFSDFSKKVLGNSDIHLSCFDMADLNGMVNSSSNKAHEEINSENVEAIINFLIKSLDFDYSEIYVSCFSGGKLSEIKPNKYEFDFYIRPDPNIQKFKKFLPEKNILLTKKFTFLALELLAFNIMPWGYRNEVFLNTNKGLIDCGTLESLYMWPIKKNGKTIGISYDGGLFAGCGIGLERVLMVKNKYNHIKYCDHIYPLYETIEKDVLDKDTNLLFIYTDALRSLHRIFSENKFNKLSKCRKSQVKKFLQEILKISNNINIRKENFKKYLEINAQLQDYYPELEKGIDNTVYEILDYFERRKTSFLERKQQRKIKYHQST